MTTTAVRSVPPGADAVQEVAPAHRQAVPRLRRLAVVVAGTALVGAAAGVGMAAASTAYSASVLVDLSSALSAASDGGVASPDQADRFVQSELLYLNSATFAQTVAGAAGVTRSEFSLTAAQVGSTDVVRIATLAAGGATAEELADGAVTAYAGYRKGLLTQDVSGLQRQLVAAQEALTAAQASGTTDLTTLQARVESLQSRIDTTTATAAADGSGGTVVESAANAGAQRTTSAVLGAGAGLAVGALLGLLAAVAPRALSRRVWTPDDAREAGVPVARPAVPAAPSGWIAGLAERRSDDPLESAARLLAARLVGTGADQRPLALVGATAGVGTSTTAVNLATALARRRPTVLVAAGDVADGRVADWFGLPADRPGLVDVAQASDIAAVRAALQSTPVDGLSVLAVGTSPRWEPVESALAGPALPLLLQAGWAVVVDCPPSTTSTAAFELASLDPVIGLVVATGRTTGDELAGAVDQLRGAGTPPSALVFDDGHVGRGRRARRNAR
jgi:Mrp family chromosome partitioning ATPase